MELNRRDALKAAGVAVAGAALSGCTNNNKVAEGAKEAVHKAEAEMKSTAPAYTPETPTKKLMYDTKGTPVKRVVIIGAGYGGLSVAKQLRKLNKDVEIALIEKRELFMSCPYSNTYLGGIKGVDLATLEHDFFEPAIANNYHLFIGTEVNGIDRNSKVVYTADGTIDYDLLVMSPGIAYDYQKDFPNMSNEDVSIMNMMAPPAMIPGSEHLALKRMLDNMDDGNVVITVPNGKYRCPPAPYERACMVAYYLKTNDIKGKVIILDHAPKPRAKAAAFMEVFKDFYGDIIEFKGNCEAIVPDLANKQISFRTASDDIDAKQNETQTVNYEVLNFIPTNKANPLIEMSGVKTNGWGGAIMDGASFRTKTDESIYVVGDCVGHAIPPSGQTAVWAGQMAAQQINEKLTTGKDVSLNDLKKLPASAANVCYSMVSGNPDEGIMVSHDFSYTGTVIKGKGNVPKPKDGNGKFYSTSVGKATKEWYRGIINELFT